MENLPEIKIQIFGHGAGESLKYQGTKFETRYRFGERGHFFVDPLIYIEYKIGASGEKIAVEGKLVLAKDIGKLNIAYNQIVELNSTTAVRLSMNTLPA